MVLLASEIKIAAVIYIMPKQRDKYITKYGLNYFSGTPATAGDQAPTQENKFLKPGWSEK